MAEETMRSPFSVGEYCANSVSSWKFDVERILLAICDRDQEECFHDSGVLEMTPSLDCLDSGCRREAFWDSAGGAAFQGQDKFHRDLSVTL